LGQARLEELITLLAVHSGEPISRTRIASNFWPESSESQARSNLRNLLTKLKIAWPGMDDAITVERNDITWRSDSTIVVDIGRFDAMGDCGDRSQGTADHVSLLSAAVDGYGGDLLPSCFSDWILTEREQLRDQYASRLEQLVDGLLERRQYEDALQRAKALQRFDPLRESTYRQLMHVYLALGDRAAALRVYHACSMTLQRELDVEPASSARAVTPAANYEVGRRCSL
jgi:DNA-binding SARP family transcriptional activator